MNSVVIVVTGDSDRVSTIFSLLADRRRRYALYSLRRMDGAVTAETLATEIAVIERNQSETRLPSGLKRDIYTDLIHTHLPKLSQADLVSYDRRTGDVRSRDLSPLVETCLCLAEDLDRTE